MIDINLKGVLYDIVVALPVFRQQRYRHFITIASTAAYFVLPTMSVYASAKIAVHTLSEGLHQEVGSVLHLTIISPGITQTSFAESLSNPEVKAQLEERAAKTAIPPEAVPCAIAFAIEQPADVDVSELVVRPTA